jgi:hypothetical protein
VSRKDLVADEPISRIPPVGHSYLQIAQNQQPRTKQADRTVPVRTSTRQRLPESLPGTMVYGATVTSSQRRSAGEQITLLSSGSLAMPEKQRNCSAILTGPSEISGVPTAGFPV